LQDQLARSTLLLEAVRNQPEAQQQRKGLIAALFGR
jgi:hypothetical protein